MSPTPASASPPPCSSSADSKKMPRRSRMREVRFCRIETRRRRERRGLRGGDLRGLRFHEVPIPTHKKLRAFLCSPEFSPRGAHAPPRVVFSALAENMHQKNQSRQIAIEPLMARGRVCPPIHTRTKRNLRAFLRALRISAFCFKSTK